MDTIRHNFHQPVLLREVVKVIFPISYKKNYLLDVTFGGGGHSKELLKELGTKATLLAFDQDQRSIANNIIRDNRLKIFHRNFRYIENILRIQGIFKVSGILADLGISSYQLDASKRGFSIRYNQTLDMRMDERIKKTANYVLNNYSHESLTKIFFNYGELKNSSKLASSIVSKRKCKTIEKTFELIEIIKNEITTRNKHKFLAKVFQALRIEVNDELNSLKFFLISVIKILRKGSRIAVISYHSLEDRLVKQYLKNGCFKKNPIEDFFGKKKFPFLLISKKPILPGKEEIKKNISSRSAKLRIAKKK